MENIQLYQGDCLEVMKEIEDKSVDMILCDLPYGKINCNWDSSIEALIEEMNKLKNSWIKIGGEINELWE